MYSYQHTLFDKSTCICRFICTCARARTLNYLDGLFPCRFFGRCVQVSGRARPSHRVACLAKPNAPRPLRQPQRLHYHLQRSSRGMPGYYGKSYALIFSAFTNADAHVGPHILTMSSRVSCYSNRYATNSFGKEGCSRTAVKDVAVLKCCTIFSRVS